MSRTTTLLAPQSVVMLSPSKKRLLDQEYTQDVDRKPTRNQLWRWCLRADAVAQCYIRDVMQLQANAQENGYDSDTIWWLGTVPCRNVKFVGMLVGAKAYEKRTIYTMDDGTGVIQCLHIHPQSAHDKQKPQPSHNANAQKQPHKSQASEFPAPLYEVGDILRISGRVEAWHDTRQIVINDFHLCRANDEPEHWITTAKLHKEYYSQPFVIPPLPSPPVPQTPVKHNQETSTVATPKTASTVPTPSTAASSSSTTDTIENGSIRLRHPSRLRSKELIASTFKIYLKNYMDMLSDPSRHDHAESPVKRPRYSLDDDNTATPRPKDQGYSLFIQESDSTPRPAQWNIKHRMSMPPARAKGFTLSFLRRVPELADMAHRVVEHERKRRAREERKKQEASQGAKHVAVPPPPSKQIREEPSGRKAKRLYMWALRELHREGSIILHEDDTPVWQSPVLAIGIWKPSRSDAAHSGTQDTADTTRASLASTRAGDECDPGALSDPPAHEESYIPLTPALLTDPILDAIKGLMARKPLSRPKPSRASSGQPRAPESYRGSSSGGNGGGGDKKRMGPTAAELRVYLSGVDARWEHVGEYTVMDALDILRREERVYRIGNGRWELSI